MAPGTSFPAGGAARDSTTGSSYLVCGQVQGVCSGASMGDRSSLRTAPSDLSLLPSRVLQQHTAPSKRSLCTRSLSPRPPGPGPLSH